ncbi:MAG: PAS domain S-box protein [Spirochaetota bacterium]
MKPLRTSKTTAGDWQEGHIDQARYQYMTVRALAVMAAISVGFSALAAAGFLFSQVPMDTLLILLAMNALFITGWRRAAKGRWGTVRYIPAAVIFLAAFYGNYIGGMGAPAVLLYVLALLLGAALLGKHAQILLFAASLSSYVTLALLHHRGILTAMRTDQSAFINRIMIAASALAGIAVTLRFIIVQLEGSIRLSIERGNELAATNEEMQATVEELEATMEEFEAQNQELITLNRELETSEERFSTAFNASPAPMSISEIETGRFIDANKRFLEMIGHTRDDVIGNTSTDLGLWHDSADRDRMLSLFKNDGTIVEFPTRFITKSGETRDVIISTETIQLEGRVVLLSFFYDITEREKYEKTLRESEERFSRAFNFNPAPMVISDIETGRIIDANERHLDMLGHTREETIGRTSFELGMWKYPEERALVIEAMREDGRFMQIPIHLATKSGEVRDVLWSGETIGLSGKTVLLSVLYDYTEQKRAEEMLRLEEERLNALLELNRLADASDSALSHFAMESAVKLTGSGLGYIAFMNDDETILTMFAWSKTAMEECGISDKPIHYPVSATGLWGEAVRQRTAIITNDYMAPSPFKKGMPDGHVHVTRHMNVPIFDGDKIVIVAGVGNKPADYGNDDIRQLALLMSGLWTIIRRKRAEDQLKESETRLRSIIDNSPLGIHTYALEPGGRLVFTGANPAAAKMIGIDINSRIGEAIEEVFPPLAGTEIPERYRRAAAFNELFKLEQVEYRDDLVSGLYEVYAFQTSPGNMAAMFLDVTKRRQAEETLRESEERFATAFRVSPAPLVLSEIETGRFIDVNERWLQILGHTREETIGHTSYELGIWEDPDIRTRMGKLIQSEGSFRDMPVRFIAKSGSHRDVLWSAETITLGGRKIMLSLIYDYTERKQAEDALRESEERFSKAFMASPMPMGISDIETGCFIEVNEQHVRVTGHTREETIGHTSVELGLWTTPGAREKIIATLRKDGSIRGLPVRWITKSGMQRDVLWSGEIITLAGRNVLLSLMYDYTERKQAEDALRESEERLRTIGDNMPGGMIYQIIYKTDGSRYFTHVSAGVERQHGHTADEVLADASLLYRQIHDDDIERMTREEQRGLRELDTYEIEARFIIPTGETRWYRLLSRPRRLENGDIMADGIEMDVTERRRNEERIADLYIEMERKVLERTEELRAANQGLTEANTELERTLSELGRAQNQLVQAEKLAALGQIAAGMAHELNTPLGAILSSNRSIIEIMKSKLPGFPRFLAGLSKTERRWFEELSSESFHRSVDLEKSVDRARRKELKSMLQQAGVENITSLLDMIIELGIHDSLANYRDLLRHERRDEILSNAAMLFRVRRLNEIIAVAADKATHVVGALKSYLRRDDAEKDGPVDVHVEMETILTLYHNKLKHGVTVKKRFATGGVSARGNRDRLNQVWMNLINNALQAMDYRGTLTISTEHAGEWIIVSFSDTGTGIPESIRDRIFEPFFTTKKHGEGIGLGLDIARSIVEGAGGRIEFESVPGNTVFRVYLLPADTDASSS